MKGYSQVLQLVYSPVVLMVDGLASLSEMVNVVMTVFSKDELQVEWRDY